MFTSQRTTGICGITSTRTGLAPGDKIMYQSIRRNMEAEEEMGTTSGRGMQQSPDTPDTFENSAQKLDIRRLTSAGRTDHHRRGSNAMGGTGGGTGRQRT